MHNVQFVALFRQLWQGDVQGKQMEPLKYLVLSVQVHVFPLNVILVESIQLKHVVLVVSHLTQG